MRSLGKGVMSATTQVKVLSPEIYHVALGQGFHFLEARTVSCTKGEYDHGVPGSESVAGLLKVCIGTWEGRGVPCRSPGEAEEATRGYVTAAFGPVHIRGVDGVMSVAEKSTRRDWRLNAESRGVSHAER